MCDPVMLEASYKYGLLNSQVVRHYWERNDIRGAFEALRKLSDYSVSIYSSVIVVSSQILYLINSLMYFLNLFPLAGAS